MGQYLFTFSISPVQKFILKARKAGDLYSGSEILSELMKHLMEFVGGSGRIIFPCISIYEKSHSLPNQFTAVVKCDDIDDFGKSVTEEAKRYLEQLAEDMLKDVPTDKPPKWFYDQIIDYFDYFWAAMPFEDEGDYYKKFAQLNESFNATKNLRAFSQLGGNEGIIGEKCSVCGENIALFVRKGEKNKVVIKPSLHITTKEKEMVEFFNDNLVELDVPIVYMREGERLCALDFMKRFYYQKSKNDSVPSTAKIALLDWLRNLKNWNTNFEDEYKKFFNQQFDEELFFKDNLNEKYLKKWGYWKGSQSFDLSKRELKKAYDKVGAPSSYYAVITFDGDHMGKWLSGGYLANKSELKDFQEQMSKELIKFAESVTEIISNDKGHVVYAGGDDILALVNLNYLFPILGKLISNYPDFSKLGFELNEGKNSTASAGVVIAHYKTPLAKALEWAFTMEKEAKNIGRNRVGLAVLRHSGEITKAIIKWSLSDGATMSGSVLNLFESVNYEYAKLSSRFINQLSREFLPFIQENENIDIYLIENMIFTELKRLIERSFTFKRKPDESQHSFEDRKSENINSISENLINIWELSTEDLLVKEYERAENFVNFLLILDFIERRRYHEDQNRTI